MRSLGGRPDPGSSLSRMHLGDEVVVVIQHKAGLARCIQREPYLQLARALDR